jgi:hypothetical protein
MALETVFREQWANISVEADFLGGHGLDERCRHAARYPKPEENLPSEVGV